MSGWTKNGGEYNYMSFVNILLAIVVFGVIILFHEFGHFIVAKWNKVGVIEFSLGMGPRLISYVKTADGRKVMFLKSSQFFEEHPEYMEHTVYSWKLFPFGGSCMMLGEEEAVEDDNSFSKKSVYARMAIIFAGPFFNFILAFLFSLVIIIAMGYAKPEITRVAENSAAAEAGIQVGDVVREINGEKIIIDGDFSAYSAFHGFSGDEDVTILVERDGQEKSIVVRPKLTKLADGTEGYMIGVNHGRREKVGVWGTIKYSAYEMKYWITTTVKSLAGLVTQKFSADDVAGPVGIISAIGEDLGNSADKSQGGGPGMVVMNMMFWCVLLSANLGVMNLLPIPALDGGRLLFLIIEWIRRKPLNPKYEGYVNMAGFMLLMLLMVVVLGHDIIKLLPI